MDGRKNMALRKYCTKGHNMKMKYDIIYSIGEDCGCAGNLAVFGLRKCSGPFDWLTHATFEKRIDLITNRFENFMCRNDFLLMGKNPKIANDDDHDYYQNTNTGFYFYHDFPIGVSFDKCFPEIHEKYQRRINRFYNNVEHKKRVLFVWFSRFTDLSDDVIIKCAQKTKKYFKKNIDFLIVENSKQNNDKIFIRQIAKNIIRYKVSTDTDIETDLVSGNRKNLTKVFCNYEIQTPFGYIVRDKFYKILRRVLSCFIPVKRWRRAMRKHLRPKSEL